LSGGRCELGIIFVRCTPLFVVDYTRHFMDRSNHYRPYSFLCCRHFSLEQLAGSGPFFSICGAVPKVAEDGTVYTILRRLTNNYSYTNTLLTGFLFCDLEVVWTVRHVNVKSVIK